MRVLEYFYRQNSSQLQVTIHLKEKSLFDETKRAYDVNCVKLLFATAHCNAILEMVEQSNSNWITSLRALFSALIADSRTNTMVIQFYNPD